MVKNRKKGKPNWFRSSIKFRIIAVTGLVISVLMVLISTGALLQWRILILNQQQESAKSFVRSFSIPVTEILINAENRQHLGGELLETHIQNFLENVDGVRYISILNNNNLVIAHSNLSEYGMRVQDEAVTGILQARQTHTRIYRDGESWILEAFQPLQIGEKRWGSVLIGFDSSAVRTQISNSFFLLLILTLLAIIITLAILYFLINRILASLRDFVAEVDKIDLDRTGPTQLKPRSDEIGYLIEHFEKLKQRLQDSRQQLEQAQKQVFHAEKLASIGRLASGVAHEVNNPLNGLRFCVYGIQQDISNEAQTQEYLTLISEGLTQIETVVTKLLGYSRQRQKTDEPLNLQRHIQLVLDLLDYRIREKQIETEVVHQDPLPKLKADPGQIQEMLMNLMLNSLDAVSEGGKIRIETGTAGDSHFRISVWDNGCGIAEEELSLIFEPFFTTKETGKGTGLGLSVTHGIVSAHGGEIRAESKPGAYTQFTITLPLNRHEDSDR
ncbi:MAG: hypothetical protein LAT75_13025 [Candidatus Cyclonatronum sp.]|uniref:ATP-binding protein n=1 Tax=Cyclonatronum sp. TaxID=3024185 RepID=UPI0025C2EEDF|nr:ATP-binding protein [Cyclonatronum sp.]MCH8487785.1 hypothetical protein [Cyclonatronum sp.]